MAKKIIITRKTSTTMADIGKILDSKRSSKEIAVAKKNVAFNKLLGK